MMTMDQHAQRTPEIGVSERPTLKALWSTFAIWVEACGEAYAASAMYTDLSRLSDAELHRRGLSRESLAREVLKAGGHITEGAAPGWPEA